MSRPGHRRRTDNHQRLIPVGSMALLYADFIFNQIDVSASSLSEILLLDCAINVNNHILYGNREGFR